MSSKKLLNSIIGKCSLAIIDNASHADVLTQGKQKIIEALNNTLN